MDSIKSTLNKIENFSKYFSTDFVAPEYLNAWKLCKKHDVYLHPLPPKSSLYLENIIKEKQPKTILEVGTGGGYSAITFANAAKEYGGKVYTIEKSAPKAEIARVHFKESGIDNISLIENKAEDILKDWNAPIDFLFLDADRKRYKEFLTALEPFFKTGTIIAADNVINFKEEVGKFIDYIMKNPCYSAEILTLPNGLLVGLFSESKENTD